MIVAVLIFFAAVILALQIWVLAQAWLLRRRTRQALEAAPSPTDPGAPAVFAPEPAQHLGTLFAWRPERFLAGGFGALGTGTLALRADALRFEGDGGPSTGLRTGFAIPLADLDDVGLGTEHAGRDAPPASILKIVFHRGPAQLVSGFALSGRTAAERWRRELQVRTGKFLFKTP